MPLPQEDLIEIYGENCPRWRSRGYVPHFEHKELIQRITFRLHDSLPSERMEEWASELRLMPPESRESERRRRIESYLDLGKGSVWLAQPNIAQIVQEEFLRSDSKDYRLHAWVVMPNHVHV